MLPVSEDSSICQQEGGSPMEAGGGQEEGAGPLREGGLQEEEEGAAALTPPSDIGKGLVLQRSLSGTCFGQFFTFFFMGYIYGQICEACIFNYNN